MTKDLLEFLNDRSKRESLEGHQWSGETLTEEAIETLEELYIKE